MFSFSSTNFELLNRQCILIIISFECYKYYCEYKKVFGKLKIRRRKNSLLAKKWTTTDSKNLHSQPFRNWYHTMTPSWIPLHSVRFELQDIFVSVAKLTIDTTAHSTIPWQFSHSRPNNQVKIISWKIPKYSNSQIYRFFDIIAHVTHWYQLEIAKCYTSKTIRNLKLKMKWKAISINCTRTHRIVFRLIRRITIICSKIASPISIECTSGNINCLTESMWVMSRIYLQIENTHMKNWIGERSKHVYRS